MGKDVQYNSQINFNQLSVYLSGHQTEELSELNQASPIIIKLVYHVLKYDLNLLSFS